jgi:DNA modification methylase
MPPKKKTKTRTPAAKAKAAPRKAPKAQVKAAAKATAAAPAPAAAPAKPMPQVAITKAKGRPMLSWVGKRPLRTVTAFPAQQVETFAPQEADKIPVADASIWKDWPEQYPNGGLLFHGDNKEVLAHLLASGFRGKVQLIYIDPPFDSGADYVRKVNLRGPDGTTKVEGEAYTLGEQIQYTDIWANDNYLQFMYERLMLLRELLDEDGSFYLHCDSTKGHHLRCLCDEIFGAEYFRNEIIWFYENKLGTGGQTFDSLHDSLFVYTKSKKWTHNALLVPVKEIKQQPVTQKINGERVWLRDESGKRIYQESRPDRSLGDVWTIPIVNPVATERTGYPTQKPSELVEKVISASSKPGDIVLDCFVGSGTTAICAQRLGRRWIACDINKGALQTTSKGMQSAISEQIDCARKSGQQMSLLVEDKQAAALPAQLGFSAYRVNDYDLVIQHNEAVNLACEHIGVTRTLADSFFDGTQGKKLVKIIPFGHPLSPADLEEVKTEIEARPAETRDVVVVCLGKEMAVDPWLAEWNRMRKQGDTPNKIEVIELRSDPKYGKFIAHKPAVARVDIRREKAKGGDKILVEIMDFISPSIVERLQDAAGVLAPKIPNWRAMVDSVMIDPAHDGKVFNIALADVPARKQDYVQGKYELPAPAAKTTVAVKVTDMLGEEVVVVKEV